MTCIYIFITRRNTANMENNHVRVCNATDHGASCTSEMHLRTSTQIPRSSEHLGSDRDTHPKRARRGAVIKPPGLGA